MRGHATPPPRGRHDRAAAPGCRVLRRPHRPHDAARDGQARRRQRLRAAPEERGGVLHRALRGGKAKAKRHRSDRRRSLAFFGQLTDPQIADEMSPARVDFLDAAGGELKPRGARRRRSGRRCSTRGPQPQQEPHAARSRDGRGKRAKLGFVITTGDLADNQQLNETRWFTTVLDGGTVDPFSGKRDRRRQPVLRRDAGRGRRAQRRRRRAALHGRRGLRRLARRPADRYGGFWDPTRRRRPAARTPRSRAIPACSSARSSRSGRRAEGAVVHRPRQPRRPRPGQRAGQQRPLPRDRDRLPEGLPERRRSTPRRSRRSTRRGVRRDRRPGTTSRRCSPAREASRRTRTAGSSPRPSTSGEVGGTRTATANVDAAEREASKENATYYSFRRARASS